VAVEEARRAERCRQTHATERRQNELGTRATVGASGELGKRAQQLLGHAEHDRRQPRHDVRTRRLVGARAEERRPGRAEARAAEDLAPRPADEVAGATRQRPGRIGPEAFGLAERLHEAREDLGAQPGHRSEVVLHGPRRHPGFARHFVQRHAEITALREQLDRGVEQALPRVQAPQLMQIWKHCDRNAIPLPS